MKTLLDIKNNYAQEQGYPNWNELRHWRDISEVADGYMNEICVRAQKAALENAAENVITVHHANQSSNEIERAIHSTMN